MDNYFDVLIPTKNRSLLLKRAVESILKQEILPNKMIIIDDGSGDDTSNYLFQIKEKYPELIDTVRFKESRGVNFSRNYGMSMSRSLWVAWLDDDDEFLPGSFSLIKQRIMNMPANYTVALFNSLIRRDEGDFNGGFQFENIGNCDFYDPLYEEIMTKFNLKGDCKPVFRRSLFENKKYLFPESVNGFESYTMNLLAKDNKGIRYFKEATTLIHQESRLRDRLSINAPRKNPWPLLVLHAKQIPQHLWFYTKHPIFFTKKIVTMSKLLVRSVLSVFRSS